MRWKATCGRTVRSGSTARPSENAAVARAGWQPITLPLRWRPHTGAPDPCSAAACPLQVAVASARGVRDRLDQQRRGHEGQQWRPRVPHDHQPAHHVAVAPPRAGKLECVARLRLRRRGGALPPPPWPHPHFPPPPHRTQASATTPYRASRSRRHRPKPRRQRRWAAAPSALHALRVCACPHSTPPPHPTHLPARLPGPLQALYAMTKVGSSRYEFIFTSLVKASPRLFTTAQAILR